VTFAEFDPCANADIGTVWSLTDTRSGGNSYTYKVKKIADEHIWMVQDLKFGSGCNKTTGSTSNATNKVHNGYYGDCMRGSNSSSTTGYMYTWQAAIQVAGAYKHPLGCSGTSGGTASGSPAHCQGICPAGWHIPTSNTNGELLVLFNAMHCTVGTTCAALLEILQLRNISYCWEDGGCAAGTGDFWPATSCGTDTLYGNEAVGSGKPHCNYGKNWFRAVRCVKNY
jgi:uncharacterized protein (TIGR02145 family)